jgi:hypothetical protein
MSGRVAQRRNPHLHPQPPALESDDLELKHAGFATECGFAQPLDIGAMSLDHQRKHGLPAQCRKAVGLDHRQPRPVHVQDHAPTAQDFEAGGLGVHDRPQHGFALRCLCHQAPQACDHPACSDEDGGTAKPHGDQEVHGRHLLGERSEEQQQGCGRSGGTRQPAVVGPERQGDRQEIQQPDRQRADDVESGDRQKQHRNQRPVLPGRQQRARAVGGDPVSRPHQTRS